jgi:hypothetical protein
MKAWKTAPRNTPPIVKDNIQLDFTLADVEANLEAATVRTSHLAPIAPGAGYGGRGQG